MTICCPPGLPCCPHPTQEGLLLSDDAFLLYCADHDSVHKPFTRGETGATVQLSPLSLTLFYTTIGGHPEPLLYNCVSPIPPSFYSLTTQILTLNYQSSRAMAFNRRLEALLLLLLLSLHPRFPHNLEYFRFSGSADDGLRYFAFRHPAGCRRHSYIQG